MIHTCGCISQLGTKDVRVIFTSKKYLKKSKRKKVKIAFALGQCGPFLTELIS